MDIDYSAIYNEKRFNVTNELTAEEKRRKKLIHRLIKDYPDRNLDILHYHELEGLLEYGDTRAFDEAKYDFSPSVYENNDGVHTSYNPLQKKNNLHNLNDINLALNLGGFGMAMHIRYASKKDKTEERIVKINRLLDTLPPEYSRIVKEMKDSYVNRIVHAFPNCQIDTYKRYLAVVLVELSRQFNLFKEPWQVHQDLDIPYKNYSKFRREIKEQNIMKYNNFIDNLRIHLFDKIMTLKDVLGNTLGNNIEIIDKILNNQQILQSVNRLKFHKYSILSLLVINTLENNINLRDIAFHLTEDAEMADTLVTSYNRFLKRTCIDLSLMNKLDDNNDCINEINDYQDYTIDDNNDCINEINDYPEKSIEPLLLNDKKINSLYQYDLSIIVIEYRSIEYINSLKYLLQLEYHRIKGGGFDYNNKIRIK